MLEMVQGKNEDIGLPKVNNHVLATHPTVNSDLYNAVRHGKVNLMETSQNMREILYISKMEAKKSLMS